MDTLLFETGYGLIPKSVMTNSDLSLQCKGIFSYLCAYAGNKDTAFPGIDLITKQLSISKDTFYKYMKELKDKGFIESVQVKEDGKFSHTEYKIIPFPKSSDTVSSDTESPYTVNQDTKSNSNIKSNSIKNNNNIYSPVIDYLNKKCGTSYKSTTKKTQTLIRARQVEGFELEDFKKVIDNKAASWLNDPKMCKFLRPETLFGNKFEGYLNEKPRGGGPNGGPGGNTSSDSNSFEGIKLNFQ